MTCLTPSNPAESVILQYSINGGASWDNLAILCYSQFLTATHVSYELTPQSQTTATRFRWWQPSHSGSRLDEWAITDLFIGRILHRIASLKLLIQSTMTIGFSIQELTSLNTVVHKEMPWCFQEMDTSLLEIFS